MAYDKVIDSAELDANLTAVADAIRTKGGTSEALSFPDGFVSAVEGIQAGGGGDDSVLAGILSRSVDEFVNSDITNLGQYALSYSSKLKTVNLPNLETAENQALAHNPVLASISLPNLKTLGGGGLTHNYALTEIYLPSLISFTGSNVFDSCNKLVTLSLPAFSTGTSHGRMCCACTALKNVDIPLMEVLPGNVFERCTSLEEIVLPSLNLMHSNCFINCSVLKKVDFHKSPTFQGTYNFQNCAKLDTVIFRGNTVASLSNVNNFQGTPFASGGTGGTVYCPSALITQYQQATNWSTLFAAGTCNFVAIEGSEYE